MTIDQIVYYVLNITRGPRKYFLIGMKIYLPFAGNGRIPGHGLWRNFEIGV